MDCYWLPLTAFSSLANFGCLRLPPATSGYLQRPLATFGYTFGYFFCYTFGYLLLPLAAVGCVWLPLLAALGYTLSKNQWQVSGYQWPRCHWKIHWNPTGNSVKVHWKPVKLHWMTSATALKFPVAPGSLELAKSVPLALLQLPPYFFVGVLCLFSSISCMHCFVSSCLWSSLLHADVKIPRYASHVTHRRVVLGRLMDKDTHTQWCTYVLGFGLSSTKFRYVELFRLQKFPLRKFSDKLVCRCGSYPSIKHSHTEVLETDFSQKLFSLKSS